MFANPICYSGDREQIHLNSLNLRIVLYKARVIIPIISDNMSTSSREHSQNKQINDTYTLHYLAFGSPTAAFRREGENVVSKLCQELSCSNSHPQLYVSSILQIRTLRLREVRQLDQAQELQSSRCSDSKRNTPSKPLSKQC